MKKNGVDSIFKMDDWKRKLDEKTRFYENIKEKQTLLRLRINYLNIFLQNEKQNSLEKTCKELKY